MTLRFCFRRYCWITGACMSRPRRMEMVPATSLVGPFAQLNSTQLVKYKDSESMSLQRHGQKMDSHPPIHMTKVMLECAEQSAQDAEWQSELTRRKISALVLTFVPLYLASQWQDWLLPGVDAIWKFGHELLVKPCIMTLSTRKLFEMCSRLIWIWFY